jgi:hypothetical protein
MVLKGPATVVSLAYIPYQPEASHTTLAELQDKGLFHIDDLGEVFWEKRHSSKAT